jgi:hypothetical protein
MYAAGVIHGAVKLFCCDSRPAPSLRCCAMFERGVPCGTLVTYGAKGQRIHESTFEHGRGCWLEFNGDEVASSSLASEVAAIDLPTSVLPSLSRATVFDDCGAQVEQKRFWRSATRTSGLHPHADITASSAAVLKTARSFKNGVQNGVELLYGRNGVVFKSRSYKNGLLHGSLHQYRDDGTLVYVTCSS